MTVISCQFIFGHAVEFQSLACLFKSGSRGGGRYLACIQVVNPLFQRALGDLIEIIDFQNVVFGIKLAHCIDFKGLLLKGSKLENIIGMDTPEFSLAMIDKILAMSQ